MGQRCMKEANPQGWGTLPVIRKKQIPRFARNDNLLGFRRAMLDYRGWPRRRLHSPRAERMREKSPVTPSA
jgi:hypothetical protein